MVFKAISDTDFIWISQQKNLQDVCEFHTALLLGTIGEIKKYQYKSVPSLKELMLCRPQCDLVIVSD